MQPPVQFVLALTVVGITLTPGNLSQSACERKCKQVTGVDIDQSAGTCTGYYPATCISSGSQNIYVATPASNSPYCVAVTTGAKTRPFTCTGCTDLCPADVYSEATPPTDYEKGTVCGVGGAEISVRECIGTVGS